VVRRAWSVTLLAVTLGLGGCGGGSTDDAIEPSAAAAVIDAQSAPAVAGVVANAVADSRELGALGGFSVPSAPGSIAATGGDAPQILAATYGPESVDCEVSGSMIVSGSQAVSQSVTVGDAVIIEFFECDNGGDAVVDGRLEFEIVAFAGDLATGQMTLTVSMTLVSLSFGVDGANGAMDGTVSFTLDTTNAPETFIALSSASFVVESGGSSATLRDYIATIVIDPMLATVTIDSSATLSTAAFDGEVSYVTAESLVFTATGEPVSGKIVVDGADDATLTISILGADYIELGIDTDGNGTVDALIMTSWDALID
jgi:hypothetical protein